MISKSRLATLAALALVWLCMFLVGGPDWSVDTQALAALYAGQNAPLAQAWSLLTALGGWIFLTSFMLGVAGWLFYSGNRRNAVALLAIVISGRLLVDLQKYLAARARPDELGQLVSVHSMSFPSGHAANSMITYLAIALLAFPSRPAVAAAVMLAVLIGISRPLLGVHWPSDVIGGWAFGLFWTLALIRFASPSEPRSPQPR